MATAEEGAETLARDTVFAAVMIILNGLVGICIFIGALRHREQIFQQTGVSASLATICALTILTLVLPNFTVSEPGPVYAPSQLAFVAVVSFLLYITFVGVQTVRHRDYFLPDKAVAADHDVHAEPPSNRQTSSSALLLIVSLGAVVLLAKTLASPIENVLAAAGAPRAVLGVIIAALVLLPESVAAAGGTGEPPANKFEPGPWLGAGDHWPVNPGRGRAVYNRRVTNLPRTGRQKHNPSSSHSDRLDAYTCDWANHDTSRCRAPRHFRRLSLHDYCSLIAGTRAMVPVPGPAKRALAAGSGGHDLWDPLRRVNDARYQ